MRPFRQELKYLIHHSVHRMLRERWGPYLVKAPYTSQHALSPVLSQYYDSPHLSFYHEKLAGVRLRNKVRIRTYGQAFRPGQTTILEIKHRQDQLVRKLRYPFPDFDLTQLDPARWRLQDPVVEGAFITLVERYRLRASAQVYYQREAYQGAVESHVRITFDTCLRALYPREKLTRQLLRDSSRSLLPDTLAILEVKATHGIPGWVQQGILAGELEQQTLPKYVTAAGALGLVELSEAGVYA